MRTIYVVSFAPDFTGANAVGGFEWRFKREGAIAEMRLQLDIIERHPREPSCDLTMRSLPVPDGLTSAEITAYIDAHLELIELPITSEMEASTNG